MSTGRPRKACGTCKSQKVVGMPAGAQDHVLTHIDWLHRREACLQTLLKAETYMQLQRCSERGFVGLATVLEL